MKNVNSYDVAIIGGGVIGTSIAFELAAEKLRVVLLDRQQPGLEASWAAAGMLSPGGHFSGDDPLVPFAKLSFEMYPEFIATVESASARSVEFSRPGAVEVFYGESAQEECDDFCTAQRRCGLRAEVICVAEARKLEPALGSAARAAACLPEEATVEPRSLMDALLAGAKNRGVEIRPSCAVTRLEFEGQRCLGLIANGERIAADSVVLAAGCFSQQVLTGMNGLERTIPTKPIRGQMVALRSESARVMRVLRSAKGYVVPRRAGYVVCGSTLEDAGFEKRVTPEGVQEILGAARELVPALAEATTLDAWAGLRPGTPDGLPILGATEFAGLLAATGHYRNGILLAPATAKKIAKLILTRKSDPEIAIFSPVRFARAPGVRHTTSF
jgi:glycine oxidase